MLVDEADEGTDPRVLVMLEHAIADARPTGGANQTVISRRFEFVEVLEHGEPRAAGYAPYLDYRPVSDEERTALAEVLDESWLRRDIEEMGRDHAIAVSVPHHLAEVRLHTEQRVDKVRAAVKKRLTQEINHWDFRADELRRQAEAGKQPRMNPERAAARADELSRRLKQRMLELDQERALKPLPPVVVGGALVVPSGVLTSLGLGDRPAPPAHAVATEEVERRAVDAVLEAEHRLGRKATDMNTIRPNNPGYDVQSVDADGNVWFIEVKGRISGATTVTVTRNEILTALNKPDRFILALVEVKPEWGDEVRYVSQPFAGTEETYFEVTSVNFDLESLRARSHRPRVGSAGLHLLERSEPASRCGHSLRIAGSPIRRRIAGPSEVFT